MSGIEIFGLIAGIISVTETLINVYGAIKDLDELPAAFHEVNNRLPLVEQILLAAKAQTKNVTKEEAKAIEDILKGSKEKVDSLLKIFKKISARLEKKSVRTFYQKVVLKLGSGSRVETLMDNVLKDLQVLSTYHAFETAIGNQAAALEKAREEIAKVEPSVPDSVFEAKSGTAINHGKDQYNSFGGTLNKFDGDQFNAERDINFDIHGEIINVQYHAISSSTSRPLLFYDLPQISISHFVERPGVINDIIANITNKSEEDTQPAVLVLCGMGGQGKSQIALKYCRSTAAMEKYRNIFWIDASSEMTTIQAFTKMASVLSGKDQFGSRKYLTQDKVKEELETWNEQWLLVFDNFDDPQAFQIHKFIPQSNKGTILITTRDTIVTQAGWKRIEMPPMTEEEALQLLLHDLKPLDKLSKDEEQASRELVKMLGYSPLAIDQARWFYSQFQFAGEIHKYIEYYKAFKDEIIKTIPTNENWGYRQTSNNKSQGWFTTFEFSLKPLIEAKNDAAVHILTISAFLGGATIWENFFREYHTTRSLTAPWSEYSNGDNRTWNTIVFRGIIADLGKRSLLLFQQNDQTMQGGAYYSLHPIIREWLRSRPESSDHDYQFEAVLMISEFIATNMDSPFPFQIQLDILTHLDSFFSETALKQKIMSKAADENSKQSIAFLFASFYRRCSRVKEAKSLLRELLDSRRQLAIEDSDPLSLDIQLELGEALGDNSEYKEAEEAFESILKFEKKLDNERHCRALLCLAALNGAQQRLRKARVLGQKVYPLVEKLSERSRLRIRSRMLLARVNGSLGYVLESARVAEQAYAEAKKLFGPVDDLALEAELLIIFNLGASGPPGQARMKLESLLQTIESRHGPEHRLTLQTIALLGEIYARGGFFKDARDCFELAKSRAETLFGDSPSAIGLEIFIARTFAGEQRNKEAEKQFKLAMKMSEQMRDTLAVRMVAGQLFYFYLMQGRLFKALPWAREFFQTFPFSHFLRTQRMFVVLPAIFIFLLGVAAFLGLGKFVLVLLVIGMITFGSQYV